MHFPIAQTDQQGYFFFYDMQEQSQPKYEPILPLLYCDAFPEKKLYLVKQAKKELAWYEHL
ncbi:uncharacterized protein BT62DRAFT_935719 [Guyanagaster necrorhizus]|uniref:Uncharacterized protein n=1 Tax=Guyanagaster necrorhizus TaxID=856835 RepID=A0A9P7VLE9_9AGAR|nr:uncharacterized protein BT62DRAFT_935719 [Guyanagaster necrorhizus MCA 3950]KAG7442690.1 hypothetical protein BT62DRAFT_935719 [Guyanagaster necrorhizus MCA 3950]